MDAGIDVGLLDIEGKVVMKLVQTMPEGCNIYIDRYFTSVTLIDYLFSNGCHCTGPLNKCRVPCLQELASDGMLRRKGRGSHYQLVRDDGQVAVIKWYDNKPILLASSKHGINPIGKTQRYSKFVKNILM